MSMVDSESVEGYRPPSEFVEDSNEALVDLNLTDSTELWLLKLPFSNDLLSDIDGQELSLNLHNDGKLASFEGSSGKVYDFVSFAAQEPDETVFVSSAIEPKIAGKISQRISVVHYPDPKELEKLNSTNSRQAHRNSAGVTVTTSSRYFPMQSGNHRSTQSSKGSRQKSSLSEVSEPSNIPKSSKSVDPFNQDKSNAKHHGHSTGISSLSSDGGKSKRRKHKD
ncbi:mediator-associated protein 2 [Gastrolobium bilobum]|uniref:mediator-associated protein 2 n=1 Tax=Gastrolobium bilobum TaxID=150636 RepID=UPI002AB2F3A1|nr:mediator-associated protein 2 [Gastrolobium bilobum]XP_061352580.1 mediator-associated protein 2 [Gastrolobium bilobum]